MALLDQEDQEKSKERGKAKTYKVQRRKKAG
jgi:hypothetical protein